MSHEYNVNSVDLLFFLNTIPCYPQFGCGFPLNIVEKKLFFAFFLQKKQSDLRESFLIGHSVFLFFISHLKQSLANLIDIACTHRDQYISGFHIFHQIFFDLRKGRNIIHIGILTQHMLSQIV